MRRIRKPLAAVLLAAALVLAMPTAAFAADSVPADEGAVLTFDVTTWGLVQGLVVPLVVGIVVKATATTRLKVLAQLIVNAIGSLLGSVVVLDSVATLSRPTLTLWAISTVATIATHYGIWKPVGVTGSEPASSALLPSRGIG